jgi:purine-nucleoside phosphorylase
MKVVENVMLREAETAVDYIKKSFALQVPTVAVILGTGLGGFTHMVKVLGTLPYAEIPAFPQAHVDGHKGSLSIVELECGKRALVMEGRFHFYEGYTPQQVAFPIVVFHLLGIKTLIVSNAAGGINPKYQVGDLMIIRDHINLTGNHPLIGKNDSILGPRFLDQTEPYNADLITKAKDIADQLNITPREGVYIGVSGPSYETKAEIRAFGILGADAVGMSTVYEVIMANYFGIKVLGVSSITNMATGISISKHDHAEVVEVANRITRAFSHWVKEIIAAI